MTKKIRRVSNFRDLGGLPASDGRFVARQKLYRSAHHGKLHSRHGLKKFKKLGIRFVIDLRTSTEVSEKPDTHIEGMRYLHLPPLDDTMNPAVNRNNRMSILKRLMEHQEGTRGHLCDVYRHMMTDDLSLYAFSESLRLLLREKEGGFLWHCTQGKDRAGIETAVVLMALGVDRETIERDYMRSNRSGWMKNRLIFALVAVLKRSVHTARSLMDLLTARSEYIKAAFDEIDRVYGDTDTFLHRALGMTDSDITSLRQAYLVP